MKITILPFVILLFFSIECLHSKAQVNQQDSLALVDLYLSTNGQHWNTSHNWFETPANEWFGITVESGRVIKIDISGDNLTGTLPSSLGNLTMLQSLQLNFNKITGNVPSSLGSLPNINTLDLSLNRLSGVLPASLQNLPAGCVFNIRQNYFNFDSFEYLFSQLPGHIYFIYANPQLPLSVDRVGNVLSVAAGGTLANNTYNWYKDNQLISTKTGDATAAFTSQASYRVEITNSVVQNSPINTDAGTLITLTASKDIFSHPVANIQDSLALVDLYNNTDGLSWFNNSNWLTNDVAVWYGITIDAASGKVQNIALGSNGLTGTVPASIGTFPALQTLDFAHNNLRGNFPSLDGLVSLQSLSLYAAGAGTLSGSIPAIPAQAPLVTYDVRGNNFTGSIPPLMGNPAYTTSFTVSYNKLTGTVPVDLGRLKLLTNLDVSNNYLTGSIPDSIGALASLILLSMSADKFTGSIPGSLGRLTHLQQLGLDNNQLTGKIPDSLGLLLNLIKMDVSNNQLTGTIPASLGNLTGLNNLALNNNQLTGQIPNVFSAFTHFNQLSFNNNQLSGPVPALPNVLFNVALQNNKLNFNGLETVSAKVIYAPQAAIPLNKHGNLFSVTAGGTLANDTFKLYKDGVLYATHTGDSVFTATAPGKYFITVTNKLAKALTLVSDTITITGLALVDATTFLSKNIATADTAIIQEPSLSKMLLTLKPTVGANALNGNVDFTVTIDNAVASYNNQPYVQRHYDVSPVSNAANAKATLKLYFTQQEFDNYNLYPVHGTYLPTGPDDVSGKSNLRVYQYHGTSASGLPGSYPGTVTVIDPDDAKIVWNAGDQYWEISFDVNGFSGFFVSSISSSLLPLSLLSFNGKIELDYVSLKWVTANEINTSYFEVQRSTNGSTFDKAGTVAASSGRPGNTNYQFADVLGLEPFYYYRLKMVDKDGYFAYSKIIKLTNLKSSRVSVIYPNPAKESVLIRIAATVTDTRCQLIDIQGRMLQNILIYAGATQGRMTVKGFPQGAYKLLIDDGTTTTTKTLIIE